MGEIKTIKQDELSKLLKDCEMMFDIVRLVKPAEARVVSLQNGHVCESEFSPCFAVWDKKERCENCISMRACREHLRMTKFEFRGDSVFTVIAVPLLVQNEGEKQLVSMELVNNVDENLILQADGDTAQAEAIKKINFAVYHDSLTGAYNRRYYDEKQFINDNIGEGTKQIGFVAVDINEFKGVNDTFGHESGDALLTAVAKTIAKAVRTSDKVIRTGGDEFLVVMKDCDKNVMAQKIRQIKAAVAAIRLPSMGEYAPSVAVGYAHTAAFDGSDAMQMQLYSEADAKMYKDKETLKSQTYIADEVTVDDEMLGRLSRALKQTARVYTDIEMDTLFYRQINIQNLDCFGVREQGSYERALERFLRDKVLSADAERLRQAICPETLKKLDAQGGEPKEICVSYQIVEAEKRRRLQSRAVFMRDEMPHHVVLITSDVTDME